MSGSSFYLFPDAREGWGRVEDLNKRLAGLGRQNSAAVGLQGGFVRSSMSEELPVAYRACFRAVDGELLQGILQEILLTPWDHPVLTVYRENGVGHTWSYVTVCGTPTVAPDGGP